MENVSTPGTGAGLIAGSCLLCMAYLLTQGQRPYLARVRNCIIPYVCVDFPEDDDLWS